MKKTVLVLLAFVVWSATGLLAFWYGNFHKNRGIANWELVQIRNDLEVWDLADKAEARRRIAMGVLGRLAIVRAMNPQVDELRGAGLEALCLLSEAGGHPILLLFNDRTTTLAREYVSSVEAEVRAGMSRLQQTMGGSGCSITPK